MVCFGAVLVDEQLDKSFYAKLKPISYRFVPEALAVSGFSRDETLGFDEPVKVMQDFAAWLDQHTTGRPVFVSDNNALIGCSSAGTSIISPAKIHSVFHPGELATSTVASLGTCIHNGSTYEKLHILIIQWTTPKAMLKPCYI